MKAGCEGEYISVGCLDGLRLTWQASPCTSSVITAGRQRDVLTIDLPSDEFGAGSAVLVQGVGVQGLRGRTSMRAFAGASASALAAPFFSASRAEHALAFVHAEHNYSRTLALFGDALFTTRQSLFAGATWRPRSAISTSATLGLGNAPYAAVSIDSRGTRGCGAVRTIWYGLSASGRSHAISKRSGTGKRTNDRAVVAKRDGFVWATALSPGLVECNHRESRVTQPGVGQLAQRLRHARRRSLRRDSASCEICKRCAQMCHRSPVRRA